VAAPVLGEDYHIIAPDLAGFGQGHHPDPAPREIRTWMRLWVGQILALLDELGVKKTHLVGNSMGGAVALHLLMEAPDRFDRVVLMGPAGAPCRLSPELDRVWGFYEDPSPRTMAQMFRWFAYDDAVVGGNIDAIAEMRFESAMDPTLRRSFEAMFPRPRQEILDQLVVPDSALRRIQQPVLLVHGRDDKVVPLETSNHLLSRLPHAQLHVYGQCSHWTQIEYRESFHRLLHDFFRGAI
jgi:2-hydroxymuconate-semialdehyde hydrolase